MNRWRCRCCQILTNDKKREVFNYKNEEYVFPYFCQKCCQRLINGKVLQECENSHKK